MNDISSDIRAMHFASYLRKKELTEQMFGLVLNGEMNAIPAIIMAMHSASYPNKAKETDKES